MSESGTAEDGTGDAEEAERRATFLELFLDLVFVFAVTQIATLLAQDPTWAGFGRGALVTWLVWWLWSQLAWTGTAADLEEDRSAQLILMVAALPTIVMASAIPKAYDADGSRFAIAYFVTYAVALLVLRRAMRDTERMRAAFVQYASFAALGPVLLVVGSILDGPWRTALFLAAGLMGFVGALASGRGQDAETVTWRIDPAHFSERHALFMIIVLGEVLVAAGANASAAGLDGGTTAGLVAAASVACVLWWIYFAFVPSVTEHALRREPVGTRGRVARDLFSFGHFPVVIGIIAFAVVAKHVVVHPGDHVALTDRWLLAFAMASVVGGFMGLHYQYNRGIALERVVALGILLGVAFGGGLVIPGGWLLLIVAIVLAVMHWVTVTRIEQRRTEAMERTSQEQW